MSPVPETPIPILSRQSFKKLPQWDFEDVYNQDASPRPTVSMLGQEPCFTFKDVGRRYRHNLSFVFLWCILLAFILKCPHTLN